MNKIRDELLLILEFATTNDEQDKNFKLDWLLEKFEDNIMEQLRDIKYQEQQLKDNLETLNFVRSEIAKGRK